MRCPHCGEPVKPGQERCFACGERIRIKSLRQTTTIDYRIFIFGGLLAVIGIIGALAIIFVGNQKKPEPKPKRKTAQVEKTSRPTKSIEPVNPGAERETEIQRAREKMEKIYNRFEKVKSQVIGETPTPQQRELINQIQRELGTMNAKITELGSSITLERKKEIQRELSEVERKINNLISQFSRAPKNR